MNSGSIYGLNNKKSIESEKRKNISMSLKQGQKLSTVM